MKEKEIKPRKTDRLSAGFFIFGIIVSLSWLVIFGGYFLKQKPKLAGGLEDVRFTHRVERWFGFYQADLPIGYNHLLIQPRGNEYFLTDEMVLKMNLLGEVSEIRLFMKAVLNLDWTIKQMWLELNSSGGVFSVWVNAYSDRLDIVLRTGGQRIEREIPIQSPPYLYTEPVIGEKLRHAGIKTGMKISFPVFEPLTQTVSYINLLVEEKELVQLNGKKISAYKVSESWQGQIEYLWVSEEGEIIKEWNPAGFSAIKISKDKALSLLSSSSGLSPDLISAFAVQTDRWIENPRQVKYLKVKLEGARLDGLDLNGDNQKLRWRVLEVFLPEWNFSEGYKIPFPSTGKLKNYLEPSWQVQSDSPEIISLAKKIAGDEKDCLKVVAKLVRWVSFNIEDALVVSIPSALEVLRQKKGACKEHTVLFTALARSLGIPTRIVSGLVYSDAYLIKGFYYHSWAEVWIADKNRENGRWVAVDPTFNQFPADATHIRLKIGELKDMMPLMQVVGQIKVRVMEYQ